MDEEMSHGKVAYVEESILGVFGLNEHNDVVEKELYPLDPKQIAAAMASLRRGELSKEATEVVRRLVQRGFVKLVSTDGDLAHAIGRRWSIDVEVRERTKAADFLRSNLESLAVGLNLVKDAAQLYELSHEVAEMMARQSIGEALSEREAIVSQSVQLLDDLDKALNVLSGKLREWYGLHFPELGRLVDDHEVYASVVSKIGDRALVEQSSLSELGFQSARAAEIERAARSSIGTSLGIDDLTPIRQLSEQLIGLYDYRRRVEEYISTITGEVAPNLSEVAGPMLAARLIQKAGGLRKLAMKPAGTIQLLGAEKAMFRALRSKAKPPKHGLIFQHPIVHTAPHRMRGRSARSLAAKLAIAARADAFSGHFIGAQLRDELNSKMRSVKNK
jgi:nucleolar protein 56